MAANSIRVKSASEYTIEVNDSGDTIVFDTSDTRLTARLFEMSATIDALTKEFEAKAKELDARTDEPCSTVVLEGLGRTTLLTKNQVEGAQMLDHFYDEARKALDGFMGPGACLKIFGTKNYLSMFEDLMEQLGPHFKKMGINAEKLKTSAAAKHAPNRAKRRALK